MAESDTGHQPVSSEARGDSAGETVDGGRGPPTNSGGGGGSGHSGSGSTISHSGYVAI